MPRFCRDQARLLYISRNWPELGRAEGIEKTYLRYCQEYSAICEFRSLHTATLMIIEKAYTKAYGTKALFAAADEASEDMGKETEGDSDSDRESDLDTSEAKRREIERLTFDKSERKRLAIDREQEHKEEKLRLEKKRLREDERERRMQRKARYRYDEKDRRRLMKARYKDDDASRKRMRKDRI